MNHQPSEVIIGDEKASVLKRKGKFLGEVLAAKSHSRLRREMGPVRDPENVVLRLRQNLLRKQGTPKDEKLSQHLVVRVLMKK